MTELDISYNILQRLGINTTKIKSKGWTTIHCPLHEDKNPSCGICINEDGMGTYNCFSCGSKGTLRQLYRDIKGNSINHDLGIPFEKESQVDNNSLLSIFKKDKFEEESLLKTPIVNIGIKGTLLPVKESSAAKNYLEKRKISIKVAESMKMKYAVEAHTYDKSNPLDKQQFINFSNRLIIPIFEKGKILSYEGREVFGKEEWDLKQLKEGTDFAYKKCIYPKGASTNTLYNLDKLDKEANIYFLEGLMDLAVLREDPYFSEKNSTTIFGANITNRQLALLTKFDSFTYIIDNDLAGWRSLKKLKDYLISNNINKNYRFIIPPFKNCGVKDIGDLPIKANKTVEECRNMKWLNSALNIVVNSKKIDDEVFRLASLKSQKRIIIR